MAQTKYQIETDTEPPPRPPTREELEARVDALLELLEAAQCPDGWPAASETCACVWHERLRRLGRP